MQMEAKQIKKKERKRMRGGLPLLWSLLFLSQKFPFYFGTRFRNTRETMDSVCISKDEMR